MRLILPTHCKAIDSSVLRSFVILRPSLCSGAKSAKSQTPSRKIWRDPRKSACGLKLTGFWGYCRILHVRMEPFGFALADGDVVVALGTRCRGEAESAVQH